MEFFAPVLECVDRALDEYGEGAKSAFCANLRDTFGFARQELVFNPEGFEQSLENTFSTGSTFYERSITREIANRFNLKLKDQFDMVGAIVLAKEILSKAEDQIHLTV